MAAAPVVLLDEPTNDLDRETRESPYATITGWREALGAVRHDVALLDLMDETVELHRGGLEVQGGGYRADVDALETEAGCRLPGAENR